jgi:hypothetical protein
MSVLPTREFDGGTRTLQQKNECNAAKPPVPGSNPGTGFPEM